MGKPVAITICPIGYSQKIVHVFDLLARRTHLRILRAVQLPDELANDGAPLEEQPLHDASALSVQADDEDGGEQRARRERDCEQNDQRLIPDAAVKVHRHLSVCGVVWR